MKRLLKLIVVPLLVPLVVVLVVPKLYAQGVQDFVITNFEADYYLANDDKQGRMKIVEDITVNFSGHNHGIERAIPAEYKGNSLRLEVKEVSSRLSTPTQYTTRNENDNLVIRIGDPDRTITGEQHYLITYTVSNVIGFYDDHDELYWDINGDQWQQPFNQVRARIHLPEGLEADSQLKCFAGRFGAVNEEACSINQEGSTIEASTLYALGSSETLTVVAGFKTGFFAPETTKEKFMDMLPTLLKITLPPLIIGGYAFRRWWRYGRDPKGRGTIIPQYDAPMGLLPAETGMIVDFAADHKDTTATIIDLAIKGYIKIIEEKKDRLILPDKMKYSLELVNNDASKLKDYEKELLTGLFTDFNKGSAVELDALKNKLFTTVAKVHDQINKGLVKGGYFRSDPRKAGGRLWVVMVLTLLSAGFGGAFLGGAFILGVMLATIMVFIFALVMPARTLKGVEAKEHAEGLKLYMATAEADRIKMMQSPNAPYNMSAEPKRTVELFEKLLPYAVVFGIEKEWAKEFKDIYSKPPEWYSGSHVSSFNAGYIAGALSSGMGTQMANAFVSPSSSGGSGFGGGGGFSGGGGGGGGGGGW